MRSIVVLVDAASLAHSGAAAARALQLVLARTLLPLTQPFDPLAASRCRLLFCCSRPGAAWHVDQLRRLKGSDGARSLGDWAIVSGSWLAAVGAALKLLATAQAPPSAALADGASQLIFSLKAAAGALPARASDDRATAAAVAAAALASSSSSSTPGAVAAAAAASLASMPAATAAGAPLSGNLLILAAPAGAALRSDATLTALSRLRIPLLDRHARVLWLDCTALLPQRKQLQPPEWLRLPSFVAQLPAAALMHAASALPPALLLAAAFSQARRRRAAASKHDDTLGGPADGAGGHQLTWEAWNIRIRLSPLLHSLRPTVPLCCAGGQLSAVTDIPVRHLLSPLWFVVDGTAAGGGLRELLAVLPTDMALSCSVGDVTAWLLPFNRRSALLCLPAFPSGCGGQRQTQAAACGSCFLSAPPRKPAPLLARRWRLQLTAKPSPWLSERLAALPLAVETTASAAASAAAAAAAASTRAVHERLWRAVRGQRAGGAAAALAHSAASAEVAAAAAAAAVEKHELSADGSAPVRTADGSTAATAVSTPTAASPPAAAAAAATAATAAAAVVAAVAEPLQAVRDGYAKLLQNVEEKPEQLVALLSAARRRLPRADVLSVVTALTRPASKLSADYSIEVQGDPRVKLRAYTLQIMLRMEAALLSEAVRDPIPQWRDVLRLLTGIVFLLDSRDKMAVGQLLDVLVALYDTRLPRTLRRLFKKLERPLPEQLVKKRRVAKAASLPAPTTPPMQQKAATPSSMDTAASGGSVDGSTSRRSGAVEGERAPYASLRAVVEADSGLSLLKRQRVVMNHFNAGLAHLPMLFREVKRVKGKRSSSSSSSSSSEERRRARKAKKRRRRDRKRKRERQESGDKQTREEERDKRRQQKQSAAEGEESKHSDSRPLFIPSTPVRRKKTGSERGIVVEATPERVRTAGTAGLVVEETPERPKRRRRLLLGEDGDGTDCPSPAITPTAVADLSSRF